MTEVVIGDDHAVFLDALGSVLSAQGFTVTTATTVTDTVRAVRKRHPDVVLIDRHFGHDDGIRAISEVVAECNGTRILILSADGDSEAIMQAMRAGASGYVHKTRDVAVLCRTIERVLAGEVVVEAPAASTVQPHLVRQQDAHRLAGYLTPRERQCLELLVQGQDTTAMVATLGVSAATVRTHVQSLLVKLGVHSRLEAAAYAAQYGLLDEQPGRASQGTPGR
jgi:two-component system, NarL family, nitrate/nitrite response regulator NarL